MTRMAAEQKLREAQELADRARNAHVEASANVLRAEGYLLAVIDCTEAVEAPKAPEPTT